MTYDLCRQSLPYGQGMKDSAAADLGMSLKLLFNSLSWKINNQFEAVQYLLFLPNSKIAPTQN